MPDNLPNKKKIDASLDLLKRQVNDLYTTTYYSPDNSEEYQTQVSDKLDAAEKAVNKILNEDGIILASDSRLLFCNMIGDHPNLLVAFDYKYITNIFYSRSI